MKTTKIRFIQIKVPIEWPTVETMYPKLLIIVHGVKIPTR